MCQYVRLCQIILIIFLLGPQNHIHIVEPRIEFQSFLSDSAPLGNESTKTYFILMALIRLTVTESFRKHNVILGESAQKLED